MSFSRRNLLRGASGLTLALPWFEAFGQSTGTPPRRVMFVFTANGDQTSRRFTTKSETGFVFDEFLAPYQPWRQDMIFMEGIRKNFNPLGAGERADNHEQGGSALAPWPSGTGSFPIGGTNDTIGYVKGPSLDRVLGDRVKEVAPSVPYKHLVYRVGDNYNNIWNQHSHSGPVGAQAPIPPETDPFKAYTRIFAGLDTGMTDALKRRLAMKQSSLDLVKDELGTLKPRLGAADKARLEQHTESVREIEQSLTGMTSQVPACKGLTMPASFNVYDATRHTDVASLFFKISAMAFACDLSRVVQFNWSGNTSDRVYRNLGHTEGHHTMSHDSSEASYSKIRQVLKHLHTETLKLYTELKAIPEAGGTVYDNTLIIHWSELSQGDTHGLDNDLVMFAGGAKKLFRTGRYLNFANAPKRNFSDMLVSAFHYMGFNEVTQFGDTRLSSAGGGTLAGLV